MTPERWKKIEELFQAARLRQTAAERAAFLDGACGTDSALRSEVEQLLTAEDSAGSFINTSAIKIAAGNWTVGTGILPGNLTMVTLAHWKDGRIAQEYLFMQNPSTAARG